MWREKFKAKKYFLLGEQGIQIAYVTTDTVFISEGKDFNPVTSKIKEIYKSYCQTVRCTMKNLEKKHSSQQLGLSCPLGTYRDTDKTPKDFGMYIKK